MLERKEEIKSLESREFYNSHRFYGSNFVITFYLLSSFLSRLLPAPFGLLGAPSQRVSPPHLPGPRGCELVRGGSRDLPGPPLTSSAWGGRPPGDFLAFRWKPPLTEVRTPPGQSGCDSCWKEAVLYKG